MGIVGVEISLSVMLVVVGVVGALIGRFLHVCVQVFPEHDLLRDQLKAVLPPWSVCHRCDATVPLTRHVPIFGWFINGRRCSRCKARLSIGLPLMELACTVLFVVVYWCEIPSGWGESGLVNGLRTPEGPSGPEVISTLWSPVVWLHLRYVFHMFMICGLIVATEIDRRLRIIPDGCTVPLMLLAVPCSFLFGQLYIVPIWFQDLSVARQLQSFDLPSIVQPLLIPWDATTFAQNSPHWHGLLVSVLGMIAGAGSVWIVRIIGGYALKQEAMGFGDVVLMGMVGSFIGWQPVLAVFVMGAPNLAILFAITNLIFRRDNRIPYGPFLSAAAILLLLTWPYTWPLAKRFFDMGPLLFLMGAVSVVLLAASLLCVQFIKRLLGFPVGEFDDDELDDGGWSSADHLAYYNSERPDEQTGQWRREQWPGSRAGRGLKPYHDWQCDRGR